MTEAIRCHVCGRPIAHDGAGAPRLDLRVDFNDSRAVGPGTLADPRPTHAQCDQERARSSRQLVILKRSPMGDIAENERGRPATAATVFPRLVRAAA